MAASVQRKNITPRSEAIVDWEILNPGVDANRCAEALGINASSLSIIKNSDAFIDYRHRRLAEHHEAISSTGIVEKTEDLAKLSLDILSERFSSERVKIPLEAVKDTCEMAMKALGFGQPRGGNGGAGGGDVNIMVGATPEQLANARGKILQVNSNRAVIIENVPEEGGPNSDPSDKLL